jgi:hypothetical protein
MENEDSPERSNVHYMSDVDDFHDPTTAALYAASNIGLFP